MRFSELDGATIGVWGAGREIRSFAEQLARRLPRARIAVAAFDTPPAADVRELLHAPRVRVVSGAEIAPELARCELIVRSPGVSVHRPELRELRARGIPVTTATALWLAERDGAGVIGVTGTKGKSTTAALTHHLIAAAGVPVRLAGNIGAAALDLLDDDPRATAVVELSSYQIADLEVGPEIVVLTNLYREHVDWHGSEDAYRAEKLRVLELPGVRACVLNARDEQLRRAPQPAIPVTRYGAAAGWDVLDAGIAFAGRVRLRRDDLPLLGEHNALNLCAALTALEAAGVPLPPLPGSLQGFQALPHRLQAVAHGGGVLWVNDSISTTPESTIAALASFPGRELVLIAGGQDRGQDHGELGRALAERGAAVIGVPSTGPQLLAAATGAGLSHERALPAADLTDAVAQARGLASPGAVVLLSPAAPSYDFYADFEERGQRFAALAAAPQAP